ncbi:hypothetical protein GCM10025864_22220 [Luteimicrobium album]|uniref:Major facilitator superfamily (MFS) profile domain-containing protein n=1 Tax=Luteimicrobium album TaxID=1054550 RepID=A0ABQ6I135_9MICO|nr:MFS transporter [Luteimicrobium album]GMA24463.1 hypothetical protein GCM10025864_22220 [Luteimicrobium album]
MSAPALTAAPRRARVPGVVLLLAAVTFCLGTSEFMIAGLLEQIADDLHVSIPQAGLLITAFAVGMVVGAPAMAVLTLRLPTRSTLVLMTVVFAAAHVLGALAPGYGVLLVSRVVAAVACGGYWAVAAVHAHRASPPEVVGRSLAALVGGLTIANLVGVPGGAWLGERYGWRTAFWVIAVVTVLAAVLVAATVRAPRAADAAPSAPATSWRRSSACSGRAASGSRSRRRRSSRRPCSPRSRTSRRCSRGSRASTPTPCRSPSSGSGSGRSSG